MIARMLYNVRHTTTYFYSDPVSLCQNQIRVRPRETPSQRSLKCEIEIFPEPIFSKDWQDDFGNGVRYVSIEHPHQQLTVTARSVVESHPAPPPDENQTLPWEEVRDLLVDAQSGEEFEAVQFRYESPFIRFLEEAREYGLTSFTPGRPILEGALDLTARIHNDFKYAPSSTAITTTTAEVFRQRCGVCQDFAHLQITVLRELGLAARYVSGYLLTEPPPGKPKLIGADASHAWLSVFVPEYGWVDLDPTNNVIPNGRHVTVAWGRDYSDVSPIKGVYVGGGTHTMHVAVDVSPQQ
ncbi:MAG: transglutaminase family protein [Planctomycetales bacterium]